MASVAQRWFLGALALIGGGTAATVAIVMAFQQEKLTCADVDEIVIELTKAESPELIPFQQTIAPLVGCSTTIKPECARRPDGTFCRNGMVYGPGIGGIKPNPGKTMVDPVIETCDIVDAEAKNVVVPCVSSDRFKPESYSSAKVDIVDLLNRLAKEFPSLEDKLTDEAERVTP